MTRATAALLAAGVVGALSACGGAPAERADSASAEVREIRLSADPILTVGVVGGDPDHELFDVRGAVRLTDGRTVVANRGTHDLRYYDENGRHLRTVGREGEGPGEFDDVRYMTAIRGDSVITYDYGTRRASWFDASGDFVRSVGIDVSSGTVRMFGQTADAQPSRALARFDGTLVVQPAPPIWLARQSPPGPGIHRAELNLFELDSAGALVQTLGPFQANEWFVTPEGRGNGRLGGPRFLVAAGRETMVIGSGVEYSFAVAAADGTVDSVSFAWPREPFTEAYRQRRVRHVYEFFGQQESWRELYDAMPKPDSLLAYVRLVAEGDERVWLGLDEEAETWIQAEPREWLVADQTGRLLGRVTMPDGLDVMHIGHGVVTGVVTDELDVEQVRAYRILNGS